MRSVTLETLRNRLSEYVRLASEGEVVLITVRDRVVAELVPPRETRADLVADAVLAKLVRQGLMTPALYPPSPPPRLPGVAKLRDVLAELDADREQ
ncbi:MAG: type II toxin-antitoxin system prevent-host-death family antitoxin [Myxococcaceae bacterium]|nr:type II toxin-antitoxin system prevent-host-death family antitoxin [Myxococcaceae bacterium]